MRLKNVRKAAKMPPKKKPVFRKVRLPVLVKFGKILHIFAFSCVILLNVCMDLPKTPLKNVKSQRKHPKLSQKRAKYFILESESSELLGLPAFGCQLVDTFLFRVCFPSSFTFWHCK